MEVQTELWGLEEGELTSSWGGVFTEEGTCRLNHDDGNTVEPLLLPGTEVGSVIILTL